jgi:DeoR family transcriptional regulator, aga operon transcriptional repressor
MADPVTTASMRYRGAGARRAAMIELIGEIGFCSIMDLCDRLGVSRMTVRRDIQQLEQEKLVRSTYGGVVPVTPHSTGTHFELRRHQEADAKRAIARCAVALIQQQPDAIIGIDAGTSALEVARQLRPEDSCTVVTHSLPVMNELSQRSNVEVIGVGGVLHPETQAFAGPATIAALQRVRLTTLILTASALRDGIIYCGNAFDADTKREMMRIADQVVLIADSSKFRKAAAFDVDDLSHVDIAITDAAATDADRGSLSAAGTQLMIAETESARSPSIG